MGHTGFRLAAGRERLPRSLARLRFVPEARLEFGHFRSVSAAFRASRPRRAGGT